MLFLRDFISDILACLRFYSRLPLPVFFFEKTAYGAFNFETTTHVVPLAGVVLGFLGTLPSLLALHLGLSVATCAGLALFTFVLMTGAFHEDGLADMLDGFGGGRTREQKLSIMKDSCIGTFGATGLIFSYLLRWISLTEILHLYGYRLIFIFMATAALSRIIGLLPLVFLKSARTQGLVHTLGRPSWSSFAFASGQAFLLAFLPFFGGIGLGHNMLAFGLSVLGGLLISGLSFLQIQGQTGDVAGAAQQVSEITYLLVLSASFPSLTFFS